MKTHLWKVNYTLIYDVHHGEAQSNPSEFTITANWQTVNSSLVELQHAIVQSLTFGYYLKQIHSVTYLGDLENREL
jgi:hypothetical protein